MLKWLGSAQRLCCLLRKYVVLKLNLFYAKSYVFTSLDVFFANHGFSHRNVFSNGFLGHTVPFIVIIFWFFFTVLTVVACAKIWTEDARLEAFTIVLLTSRLATVAPFEVFLCVAGATLLGLNHKMILTVAGIRGNSWYLSIHLELSTRLFDNLTLTEGMWVPH